MKKYIDVILQLINIRKAIYVLKTLKSNVDITIVFYFSIKKYQIYLLDMFKNKDEFFLCEKFVTPGVCFRPLFDHLIHGS